MTEKIEGYMRLVATVWDTIEIYEGPEIFLSTYATAEKQASLLYAAYWTQYEICNGGFRQVFWNSTGVLVPEGVEGLRALGMNETAETVVNAMQMLGHPYPRQRKQRQDVLAGFQEGIFRDLDK